MEAPSACTDEAAVANHQRSLNEARSSSKSEMASLYRRADRILIGLTNTKVKDILSFVSALERLYPYAEGQAGHITACQGAEAGVSAALLSYYTKHGDLQRIAHGIYRMTYFPPQRFEDFVVCVLWADRNAMISHDSALAVYELADAMPSVIHITVPRPFRGRRERVRIHHRPLSPEEGTMRDAVVLTTVERTLLDIVESGDTHTAECAAQEAFARGLTNRRRLQAEIHRFWNQKTARSAQQLFAEL